MSLWVRGTFCVIGSSWHRMWLSRSKVRASLTNLCRLECTFEGAWFSRIVLNFRVSQKKQLLWVLYWLILENCYQEPHCLVGLVKNSYGLKRCKLRRRPLFTNHLCCRCNSKSLGDLYQTLSRSRQILKGCLFRCLIRSSAPKLVSICLDQGTCNTRSQSRTDWWLSWIQSEGFLSPFACCYFYYFQSPPLSRKIASSTGSWRDQRLLNLGFLARLFWLARLSIPVRFYCSVRPVVSRNSCSSTYS